MTIKEIGILILIIFLMLFLLGGFALFFIKYRKKVKSDSDNGEYDLDLLLDFKNNSDLKIKKRKHTILILRKIFSISLIIFISVLLVFGVLDKAGVLKVGSKSIIVIASGSMSEKNPENDYLVENNLNDQFPKFAIIVIEKVDPNDLKQYDTIVYKNENNVNIIHRIVRIEKSSSGRKFITRGDANNLNDTFESTDKDIMGRYTGKYVPILGAVVLFIQSAMGIATMLALIIGLLLVDTVKNKIMTIHYTRLSFILEELSLNENNIQNYNESDLQEMINSHNLKPKTVVEESDNPQTQEEKHNNQNDISNNSNNDKKDNTNNED